MHLGLLVKIHRLLMWFQQMGYYLCESKNLINILGGGRKKFV